MDNPRPTHVIHLLEEQAQRVPTQPALSWLSQDGRQTLNWAEYRHQVWAVASGLLDMGVKPGETVAILAPNIVEHYVADLAAILCGAVTVSLYPTLADEQLAHILADAAPVVVVSADATAADRISRALPKNSAARIVCVHGDGEVSAGSHVPWADVLTRGSSSLKSNHAELSTRLANSRSDDVATYIYTSGTTGMPKGVILTHANLLYVMEACDRMGFFVGGYRVISYLPLAHIAERLWSLYFPLKTGGDVLLCPDQGQLMTYLRLQRPSFFMGVPRVWEKLRDAATMILSAEPYASRSAEVAADRDVLAQAWSLTQDGSLTAGHQVRALKAREGSCMISAAISALTGLSIQDAGLVRYPRISETSGARSALTSHRRTDSPKPPEWQRGSASAAGAEVVPALRCRAARSRSRRTGRFSFGVPATPPATETEAGRSRGSSSATGSRPGTSDTSMEPDACTSPTARKR